ncbi:MAG: Gfo/Idh/MocA family oxidoreductase [Candidatus Thorarchaeota archaeon]|nr:Gfo/Idh/MocA family oxidoreductase [Candidatus Thorarchaeota archaeon]
MSGSENRTGLGLIGTGNIGRTHLIGISSLIAAGLVDVDLVALCDTDKQSLKSAAELFEVPTTYTDYANLITDDNVDIVYVCTPTNRHPDIVKAAARAGKSVFCEKPLAHSCPQARDMLAVTQDAGVHAGVDLVLRYDQYLLYARELLKQHDFGNPMLVHIRDDQRFPVDYIYYSRWRGDKSIAGGGTLIEHSIHDVDLLVWLLGKVSDVYARVGFYAGREVEDMASLSLHHKNGAISTIDSIWHWVERPNERYIELFYEKGYIGIRLESGQRFLEYQLQDSPPIKVSAEKANHALLRQLGLDGTGLSADALEALTAVGTERYAALSYAFLNAIKHNQQPTPSFLDAITAHNIVDAAYESANLGRPVDIL